MTSPRRHSPRSSTASGSVEFGLPAAPWLFGLLALPGAGLPLYLLLAPLHHGGWAAAGCLCLALLAAPEVTRLCLGRGPRAPRRLSFTPEGQFRLDLAGGYSETVVPADSSLVAGPWWILVLDGPGGRYRVVLETFRMDAGHRAALGRCLRRVASRPGGGRPALRSLIDPGRPG